MGRLTELLTCPTHPNPTARYPSWADYNNDGFEDLLLMDFVGPAALFQNNLPQTGNTNHWLKIQLKGLASNPNGLGAKYPGEGDDRWQVGMANAPSGCPLLVDGGGRFGLGDATTVDVVRIEWPSGNVQELTYVTPDQLLTVKEVVGIAPDRPSASLNGAVLLRSTTGSNHQWRFEGVDLAGQTNRTLALTNLTAAQQGRYSVVARNSTGTATNFVYLHVDTTFTKITTGPQVTDLGSSWGACWGDYDGDGFADLFVARNTNGLSALYHNNRDGTFARVSNAPFPQTADAWDRGRGRISTTTADRTWLPHDGASQASCTATTVTAPSKRSSWMEPPAGRWRWPTTTATADWTYCSAPALARGKPKRRCFSYREQREPNLHPNDHPGGGCDRHHRSPRRGDLGGLR